MHSGFFITNFFKLMQPSFTHLHLLSNWKNLSVKALAALSKTTNLIKQKEKNWESQNDSANEKKMHVCHK